MDVTKFKPSRRLDAMVAMALGWRWFGGEERLLYPLTELSSGWNHSVITTPIGNHWDAWITENAFSTRPGAAFEAALEAGVLELRSIGQYEQSGVDFFEIDDGDTGVLAIGETAAHCLCLGILAIQPEDKLAEFESWLPEEVE